MNKVMLIGNVGKEPDVRYYDADQAVAQVTLATTEKGYTLANGTQVPDRTEWHTLVFYRTLAKIVEKYVHKGDKLYVHVLDLQDDALYLPLAEKVGEARCLNNGERVKFDTLRGKGIVLNLEHVPEDTDRIIELTLR